MIKNINNIRMCSDLIQAYIFIILSELYAMAIILKKIKTRVKNLLLMQSITNLIIYLIYIMKKN